MSNFDIASVLAIALAWTAFWLVRKRKRRIKKQLENLTIERDQEEERQREKFVTAAVDELYAKVVLNRDTIKRYRCQVNFCGKVRWKTVDLIELRDKSSNVASNQGKYKARIEHASAFEIYSDFDLTRDDHLRLLLTNLYRLQVEKTCEMIEILEAHSTRDGCHQDNYSDAYDFDGVAWFEHGEDVYQEQYAFDDRAKICTILEGQFEGTVIEDTENRWCVVDRESDYSYTPFERDLYDGIDLDDQSGIVCYLADESDNVEILFSLDEIETVIRFLVASELRGQADSDLQTGQPT
jgi:hypothetical protein